MRLASADTLADAFPGISPMVARAWMRRSRAISRSRLRSSPCATRASRLGSPNRFHHSALDKRVARDDGALLKYSENGKLGSSNDDCVTQPAKPIAVAATTRLRGNARIFQSIIGPILLCPCPRRPLTAVLMRIDALIIAQMVIPRNSVELAHVGCVFRATQSSRKATERRLERGSTR
jgi:hypothetical protein